MFYIDIELVLKHLEIKMRFFSLLILLLLTPVISAAPLKMTIRDPEGKVRNIYYQTINGVAVAEGDIILGKTPHKSSGRKGIAIIRVGGTLWDNGIIPLKFSNNLPEDTINSLLDAIALWEKNTRVKFIIMDENNAYQYPDHILVQHVEGTTCASEVGKEGGEQLLYLATRCKEMNITHELGHALGLWHEQSRHDRDQYVRIVWDNIQEEYAYNFNQHLTDGKDVGPYNYDSLMHYSFHAFSKNGEQTIIPLQEGVTIGQRDHLSMGDIDAVNQLY